ncbi:MAG: DUF2461 domain-containing protein [Sphingobacteriaceae bacterium]
MLRPETFDFLQGVKENNNRDWFLAHKTAFEQAKANVLEFAQQLIKGLAAIDPVIPADLDPKLCVMRIYRDVRFSKNKSPYKENFAIAISAKGKNFDGPGYYLHIHPIESFLAGGCWMPDPNDLKAIRQEIDYNGDEFRGLIESVAFKKYFGGLDTSDTLKTVPKGYAADHPDIAWLKLKSFIGNRTLNRADLCKPDAVKTVLAGFETLYPLMVFLRNALS